MIKASIQFGYVCVSYIYNFECIPLCICRILFSFRMHYIVHLSHFVFKCRNTIIFVAAFCSVGFVDFKFTFCCEI